ncbi:cap binding protein [Dendryphion nanum]|uniref:Cap binding protein n=1 Tax=Dendryphion nanum TaxID=256645 RepID=A0A9P9DN54_9PLEO|nr:cap binding protein [Dendryphion nanum]
MDNEHRGDRNRGRGRRNNHGQKRGREDDENHYDGRNNNSQRPRHDHGPSRRYEEPPFSKLRRLILNIAGSTNLPQDEAIEIAKVLGANFDDERLRNDFFDIVVQLVIEQPFKIPFVAAVALYGNYVKPEITTEALKRIAALTQEALNAGRWKDFKLLLRFFACLQSQFDGDGVFTFLGQLFDTVVDLQSANENDIVGIELVKIILLTIPYALVSGGPSFNEQAQELLKNTGIVASNVLPMEGLIHSYVAEDDDTPIAYHSVIGLLQQQLLNEAESEWALACIPRFDPNHIRKPDDEESMAIVPPTHAFPQFQIPSPVNPGPKPLFPESYFSLYTKQEIETVPKIDHIAASLIRDTIVDTIDQLDFNRDAASKFLVDLDCYWSEKTFAKRGIAYDKFRETIGDKALWKSEDMIIDAIFSQLFKLPNPEHKLVYYHSLITQCCKIAPAAIAPSLGRAIRAIYKSLDIMDLQLADRFLDWFSHHLSNFEFRWRWGEWTEDVKLSDHAPKKAFIIAAIEKEIRLSFSKRIRHTVPEEMHHLIPERLDEDQSPEFKYDNADTPFAAEGQALLHQLRKKASADDIQETINKIHEKAVEQGIADVLVPSTDAFVTAICRLGAKSLSHVLSSIERGVERLQQIAQTSDAARRQIAASVVQYWKDQPGVAVRIIVILLNYQVLAPMTVAQWALGDYLGAGECLSKSWLFDMVSITMSKVAARNHQIVAARLQNDLSPSQIEVVEKTLNDERASTRELFKYIDDQLKGIVDGSADTFMEIEDNGGISQEDVKYIRSWAARWRTVFLRKGQVEESIIGEVAIEAGLRLLPPPSEPDLEPEPQVEESADGNGMMEDLDVANLDDEML